MDNNFNNNLDNELNAILDGIKEDIKELKLLDKQELIKQLKDQVLYELLEQEFKVEYKKLGEIIKIQKGKQINKKDLSSIKTNEILIPVFNGGKNPSGYTFEFNCKGPAISISEGGASAGFSQLIENNFWSGAHNYAISQNHFFNKESLFLRYIYHIIKYREEEIMTLATGSAMPNLKKSALEKLIIPVPPLHIQKKIAQILDLFNELEAELEAELELRRKQYTFYREQLLDFRGGNILEKD